MTLTNDNKLLVILGPTATGKTTLSLSLAKKFNGELISADSRQVYTGLDIGTGKITSEVNNLKKEKGRWIVDGVVINLYDIVNPKRQYHLSRFIKDAKKVIKKIHKDKKLPILVGGTGLYIRALLDGFDNLSIPVDKRLRAKLDKLSLEELQQKLKLLSLEKWSSLNQSDRQNPRRLLRAIELIHMYPYASKQKIKGLNKSFDILKIGLSAPKDYLYKKADKQVQMRIDQGMINEAKYLSKEGLTLKRFKQLGLEYGVLAQYLKGDIKSKDQLIKTLQGKIHGYVRRQLTYFKKEKEVNWIDITDKNYLTRIENKVSSWYHLDK